MNNDDIAKQLYDSIGMSAHKHDTDIARLTINGNEVVGAHLVDGLEVETEQRDEGIAVHIVILEGTKIIKPVQLCFGMLPEKGLQRIEMKLDVQDNAEASVVAHCTFPNAVEVEHLMDADINIGAGARYSYFERHVHGPHGGVKLVPKAKIRLGEESRFRTEFELIKGRVGVMNVDYEAVCAAGSSTELVARISGSGNDIVEIHETATLEGENSRAVLQSIIALKDNARGDIYNTVTATAPGARGHVDCKEIVQGDAVAKAVPVVDVRHPGAHVTHEAAIGSVDSKQLQTLMARGLDDEQATDLIVEGMLGDV